MDGPRSAMYIHELVKHSRRKDLEVLNESMVTITLHPARTKPLNIVNYYRQWQICQPSGVVPNTDSVNCQLVNKYQEYICQNNTVTLSDTNLDFNI